MYVKFCPRCSAYFSDPDKYAVHIKVCGKEITEVVKEKKPVEKAVPAANDAKSDLLAKQAAAFAKPPK